MKASFIVQMYFTEKFTFKNHIKRKRFTDICQEISNINAKYISFRERIK